MEFAVQQLLLGAISAFFYFFLRPTVRQLRDAGAQPWTVGYHLAFPVVLWIFVALYGAGLAPSWTALVLGATLVPSLVSIDSTIKLTGGRRRLATFGFKVLEIEAAVLNARAADGVTGPQLTAAIARQLDRLDRLAHSSETRDYADGFRTVVTDLLAFEWTERDRLAEDRLEAHHRTFYSEISRWGAKGKLLQWVAPDQTTGPPDPRGPERVTFSNAD